MTGRVPPRESVEPGQAATPPQGMTPDPAAFRLAGDPPRVMRLSRKALATIGIAAGLGIGGALIYALQPVHHDAPPDLYEPESRSKADIVTSAPSGYDKVPRLGAPLPGDLGRPILAAQAAGKEVEAPALGRHAAPPTDPYIAAAEQAREQRRQERESARNSALFQSGASGVASAEAPGGAGLPVVIEAPKSAAPSHEAALTGQGAKRAFLDTGRREAESSERLTAPSSPYVLHAGSVVPAALLTGIQSDLPGQITGQVTQNVYDSQTGRILLIPQGARLIGTYDSDVSAGQNRVLLAWDRLIMPDGRSLLLERQPGADLAGMAGLHDRVDYHWGSMMKAALVSTLLGVGTQLVAQGDNEPLRALRYGLQDSVNQTGRQLVQREMGVPPTLTIRPGAALRVIVTRDLILEPRAETKQ